MTDETYCIVAGELRTLVERLERLDAEKQDIAEQSKEVMAEAKSRGYATAIIHKLIAMRKKDASALAEEESVLAMYREALGM